MTEASYLAQLRQLVAIDSTSPMSPKACAAIDEFLAPWGFVRGDGATWVRVGGNSARWVYAHIDTKPALPRNAWSADPWTLTEHDGRLFGLGVSDSKFQLLNLLHVAGDRKVNILIDGEEESGGLSASSYLQDRDVDRVIVVDGSGDPGEVFSGTMGQLDGVIELTTGEPRSHPARKSQRLIAVQLAELLDFVLQSGLHFNMTQICSPASERSLTMEELAVRFDIRYRTEQAPLVSAFLNRWGKHVQLKQHYLPFGKARSGLQTAPFSMALGNVLGSNLHVVVVPGARLDNGNHRPDEWIELTQVGPHQETLCNVLANEFEVLE